MKSTTNVTDRLRAYASSYEITQPVLAELLMDASEEITKLRAEVERLKKRNKHLNWVIDLKEEAEKEDE